MGFRAVQVRSHCRQILWGGRDLPLRSDALTRELWAQEGRNLLWAGGLERHQPLSQQLGH